MGSERIRSIGTLRYSAHLLFKVCARGEHCLETNVNGIFKMRLGLILTLGIALVGCTKSVDQKLSSAISDSATTLSVDSSSQILLLDTTYIDYENYFNIESYLTRQSFESLKPEIIDIDCAILIYPTPEQLNEMKKESDEQDFYAAADDNNWYQVQAIEMIDSAGVKKTIVSGRFLRLIGKQKTWDLDVRKKYLPSWNLIFFKTDKEPKVVSTVDLTFDEVREYFNNE